MHDIDDDENDLEEMSERDLAAFDDDDEVDLVPCQSCGRGVYEDAEQCPYCGEWLTRPSANILANRPWWFLALAWSGILGFILVSLFALCL